MDPSHNSLLSLVNASGFLFQLRVEQEISATQSKHRKSVLAHEHRWTHPATQQNGFIDLITTAGTNGKIVMECKRLRAAEWAFLIPPDAKPTTYLRILWAKRFSAERRGSAWDAFALRRESLEAEFCVVRGQADAQIPMLERLSTTLLASVEALANEELAFAQSEGSTGIRFYFPAIVTTATLYVCRVDPSRVDIASGELKDASFEEVPFIRFTKSMATSLTSSHIPSGIQDAAKESRRTVFVVNAAHLAEFLAGEWEFNTPPYGGPWPWDLPAWAEVQ